MEALFGGVDQFDKVLPSEVSAQLNESVSRSVDPQTDKKRWANITFLADRSGQTPEAISQNYARARDNYARQQWGFNGPAEDGQFYDFAGSQLGREKAERQMLGEMQANLSKALIDGTTADMKEAISGQMAEFQTKADPRFNPTRSDLYFHVLGSFAQQKQEQIAELQVPVALLKEYFTRAKNAGVTGGETLGFGEGEIAGLREEAQRVLERFPQQDQDLAIYLASHSVQQTSGPSTEGTFAARADRGVSNTVTNVTENIKRRGHQFATFLDPSITAQEEKAFGSNEPRNAIGRKLDGVVQGTLDPLKGPGWLSNGLMDLVEGFPEMILAFTPGGATVNFLSTSERLHTKYEQEGISSESASLLADVVSIPITAAQFISTKMVFGGKVPFLGKVLSTPVTTGAELAKRIGLTLGAETVTQGTLNELMSVAPELGQQLASQLSDAYPGVDWKKYREEWAARTPEDIARMIPMVLIGTGIASFHEAVGGKEYIQQRDLLEKSGFTPPVIQSIMAAPTVKEAATLVRDNWKAREPAKPDITVEPLGKKYLVVEGVGEPVEQFQVKRAGEERGVTMTREQMLSEGIPVPGESVKASIESVAGLGMQALLKLGETERNGVRGITGYAYELGSHVQSPEDLEALQTAAKDYATRAREILTSGDMERFDEAQVLSSKAQVFREAYEAATDTGSAKGALTEPPAPEGVMARSVKQDVLASNIVQNDNGTYTVSMPDGNPVGTVSTPEAAAALAEGASALHETTAFTRVVNALGGDPQTLGIVPPGFQIVDELLAPITRNRDATMRALAGHSAPATTSASEEAGNALVRYASSKMAAPHVAKAMTAEVLGPRLNDAEFRSRLGSVLVEDRLRAIKRGLENEAAAQTDPQEKAALEQAADRVVSIMGDAEFHTELSDPEIQQAIERHKATIQKTAEQFHTETGGKLAGAGLETGAFVNLQAVFGDDPTAVIGGGTSRGNLTNPLKQGSRFAKTAKGTGEQYVTDYADIAERMVEGNFAENAKRQLYKQLLKDGLGKVQKTGEEKPANTDGWKQFPIERRLASVGENLWVRPDVARELRQALNVDGVIESAALQNLAKLVTGIQLAGPVDAVFHTANILSAINGSQGGRSLLADLARKIPGVNLVTTLVAVTRKAMALVHGDTTLLRDLSSLAESGALRDEGQAHNGLLRYSSKFIGLVDKAGRLVLKDMFDNLTERGLAKNTERNRREFVNQVGQYNSRLHGQFQRILKEVGISPFIVAGKTFNRNALRRLTASPGFEAASRSAAIQARAVEIAGLVTTLLVVPATLNYLVTGSILGRPGTPQGAIDTGKDDKRGRHIVIDPLQWTGLRRGLRLTGINAAIQGARSDQSFNRTGGDMARDIINSAVHPYAGPIVRVGAVALTGKSISGFREAPLVDEGLPQIKENLKAAAKELNPSVGAFLEGRERGGPRAGLMETLTSLGSAAGVKEVKPLTAVTRIYNLADQYKTDHDIPKDPGEHPVSQYKPLKEALRIGDMEEAVASVRTLLEKKKRPLDVSQDFHESLFAPFTGSKKGDKQFRASLDEEKQAVYDEAVAQRKEMWTRFRAALQEARAK